MLSTRIGALELTTRSGDDCLIETIGQGAGLICIFEGQHSPVHVPGMT